MSLLLFLIFACLLTVASDPHRLHKVIQNGTIKTVILLDCPESKFTLEDLRFVMDSYGKKYKEDGYTFSGWGPAEDDTYEFVWEKPPLFIVFEKYLH